MIKDILTLLCIHPEKGWLRKRSALSYVLLAAALSDLAMQGCLCVRGGRIHVREGSTGDKLLDELIVRLVRLNGKKFSWTTSGLNARLDKYFRLHMAQLEENGLIDSRPVEWMGIVFGKRYRVRHYDKLKPLLAKMDKVLIYGRKPDLRTGLLIEYLGVLGLLGSFFPDAELRKRAIKISREMQKQSYADYFKNQITAAYQQRNQKKEEQGLLIETLAAIRKELRTGLRMQQARAALGTGS